MGKEISVIKRHLAVATQRLVHAFAIAAANNTDRQGALVAFEQNKEELEEAKGILCDGGYTGKPFADGVKALLGKQVDVPVVRRNEMHTLKLFQSGGL